MTVSIWPHVLEQPEQEAAEDRAEHAAGDDHRAHLEVDAAAAAVGEHAGDRWCR